MVSSGKRGIRDPAAISFSIRFREITNDWSGDQGRGPENRGRRSRRWADQCNQRHAKIYLKFIAISGKGAVAWPGGRGTLVEAFNIVSIYSKCE